MNWYYAQNNQRHGPVSENEFDFLVHQKKILPGMLVWNETMPDWRPLREVLPETSSQPPPFDWTAHPTTQAAALERNGPAWEDRDSIGGLNAAAKTVAELVPPINWERTFARMKLTGGWVGPFCFALFMGGMGMCASLIYSIILIRLGWPVMNGSESLFASDANLIFMLIFSFFFIPMVIAGTLVLNSTLIHFSLAAIGGAKQPFQATWRVVCYSYGASSVFQFIPIFGGVISFAWTLILMITGIARVHEISAVKAALCMTPILLYMGLLLAIMLAVRMM